VEDYGEAQQSTWLSKIFNNHRLPLRYVEHDPATEQWHCDDVDQSKRCWYLSMPFQELQSAQKLDDPHRRDPSKNLQKYKFQHAKVKGAHQKTQGASRKLTLQLLASRFYDSNKERVAIFEVNNLGH
jgi:hypothetical protein